jgi:DNA-binding beta-propeller fold protein YncE
MRIVRWASVLLISLVVLLLGLGAMGDAWPPPGSNHQTEQVSHWGELGSKPGQFNEPAGIAVNETEVFVADARNKRIQVFDLNGNALRAFGQTVLRRPMNLALHGDTVYVPDYLRDSIEVFDSSGPHLRSISPSDGFNSPGGVDVFPDGSLLIADTYRHRVLHLSSDGDTIQQWGATDSKAWHHGQFNYPTDVQVLADGGFVVADGYNDRLQWFSAEGDFVRAVGGPFGLNISGGLPSWFRMVSAVTLGANGELYAVDFHNARIQSWADDGQFVAATKSLGSVRSLFAVAVAADGRWYTTNMQRHRVDVWRVTTED